MKDTEAKHTAGPWTYVYSGTCLDLKGNCGNTLIAEFPTLAREEGCAYVPSEEDSANLRLIAAAPDLLEACIAMQDALTMYILEDRVPFTAIALEKQLTQAIAKASGQEGGGK